MSRDICNACCTLHKTLAAQTPVAQIPLTDLRSVLYSAITSSSISRRTLDVMMTPTKTTTCAPTNTTPQNPKTPEK